MSVPSLARFKRCRKCGCIKPETPDFFYFSKGKTKTPCKVCTILRVSAYAAANPQEVARRKRAWHHKNRDAILAQKRSYRERHAAEILEKARAYYAANRNRIVARVFVYTKENPEKVSAARARRRALERNAEHEPYTPSDIVGLWRDQGGLCFYCGALLFDDYHVEHKNPLSRGGADRLENICLACPPCNFRKHTKTAEEFLLLLDESDPTKVHSQK